MFVIVVMVVTPTSVWLDKRDTEAGHHISLHLRRSTSDFTHTHTHIHTQLFTYQRHLSSPLPPLLSIFVTKATTE